MEVSPAIAAMAKQVCGIETNLAKQANLLLNAVADYADHYSKDASKPKCSVGDAGDCMANAGGCCTDLHSMFIALARARGIPSRLQMGYRLREPNEGKEVDPGYRCWAEYYVPGYGWVASDLVEADAVEGDARQAWLTGLTERRLWLNQGREFILTPKQAGPRVNTMVIGYAEIDGKAVRVLPEGELAAQLSRKVHFVEVADQESAALKVSAEINSKETFKLSFDNAVKEKFDELLEDNFKLYKKIMDDPDFASNLLDVLFERYLKRLGANGEA